MTPFIDEDKLPQGCVEALPGAERSKPQYGCGAPKGAAAPCAGAHDDANASKACAAKRKKGTAKSSATKGAAGETGRALNTQAASVIMTSMYAARLARPDLLRCVGSLATKLTKWDAVQDKKLHKMMCYIQTSLPYRQVGFIGDPPSELWLDLFTDADHAGDREDMKSTSGTLLALRGPNTFFPLGAVSKKQTAQSHSTPESEIVAADAAVRTVGIPALDLWETILGRAPEMKLLEDNQATARIIQTGKFPTMRHVNRVHGSI